MKNLVEELRGILSAPAVVEATDMPAKEIQAEILRKLRQYPKGQAVPIYELAKGDAFRGLHFKKISAAADALVKAGKATMGKAALTLKEGFVPLRNRGLSEVVTAMVNKLGDEVTAARAEDPEIVAKLRSIVANQGAAKVGGVMVDMFSASAAVQVYDALSDANKAHMAGMPIRKMMDLVFKMLARRVV